MNYPSIITVVADDDPTSGWLMSFASVADIAIELAGLSLYLTADKALELQRLLGGLLDDLVARESAGGQ